VAGLLTPAILTAAGAIATLIITAAPMLILFGLLGAAIGLLVANWQTVSPAIMPAIETVKTFFTTVWEGITAFVNENLPMFQAAWDTIVSMIQIALGIIQAIWSAVWPSIRELFNAVWTQIKGILQIALGAMQIAVGVFSGIFTGDWSRAWNLVKSGFTNIWEGIKNSLKGYLDSIIAMFKTALNGIIGMLNGFISVINKAGAGAGIEIKALPSFDTGGPVPYDMVARLHEGEFVLSKDMISGKSSIPSGVVNDTRNQSVNIYTSATINNPLDIDLMAQRLAFELNTRGRY